MNNWMSFYIHDSGKIAPGDLRYYRRIAELEGIDKKDTSWHRAEWTTENYDGLKVEVADNPTRGKLIDSIYKRWKSRTEFFEWAALQLVELDCSVTDVTELPDLPECRELNCIYNNLTKLPKLPKCKRLYCYGNDLTELPELPECEVLHCLLNNLIKLPELPKCEKLICYSNKLTELPELPECEFLDCSNNRLTKLPELPECEELHCYRNPIKEN